MTAQLTGNLYSLILTGSLNEFLNKQRILKKEHEVN
jgi:hypothetical protein